MADDLYAGERWKTISVAPDYSVSDYGRVRRDTASHPNARPGQLRKQVKRNGYAAVSLSIGGKQKALNVHRLVALAFFGEPPTPGHFVAHNDGDKANNHVGNLRWATPAENTADRRTHGTALFGKRHANAKLTDEDIRAIRAASGTQTEIARQFGTTQANVSLIRRREAWAHIL